MAQIKKLQLIISSLSFGGAERVMSELANSFAQRGIEVQLVLVSSGKICYNIDSRVQIKHLYKEVNGKNRAFRLAVRLSSIRKCVREFDADAIITFLCERYVCFACLGLGKKIFVSERSNPAVIPADKAGKLIKRTAFKIASGRVFQTEQARDYYGGNIAKNSVIIPNPLKKGIPERFEGERRSVIASAGRLLDRKNFQMLLKAFSMLPERFNEISLEIYGEGPELESLKKLSQTLGISDRTRFCGNRSDLHERIRDVRIFALTSDYEGLPNVLIEAMALGLACVSTDCPCGGPASLIQDGVNGFLVGVGDENALCDVLTRMLENPELCEKVGKRAAEIKEICDVNRISDKWLEYIQRTCEN